PQAVDHLPRRRLDGPDLHTRVALLEEAPDAEQGAAGAQPGHEVGDLRAVPPDLGPGALVVGLGVGLVAVLVEKGVLRVLLGEVARQAYGAVRPLGAGRLDDRGAPHLTQLA